MKSFDGNKQSKKVQFVSDIKVNKIKRNYTFAKGMNDMNSDEGSHAAGRDSSQSYNQF